MYDKIWNLISDLENLDHIASIAASVAIFITAIFGALQIKRWKDEKRFESEFESAFRIMKIVYRSQLSLQKIQTVKFHESEYHDATDSLYERGIRDTKILKDSYAVEAQILINRLQEIMECYREIADTIHEAKVLFGDDNLHDILYDLSECFNELQRITDLVIMDYNRGNNHDKEKRENEVKKLNDKINSIVFCVEKIVLPVIRYKRKS